MEILITGMHRSGTSALAHMLARGTKKSLLDDPEWAIVQGCTSYRDNQLIKNTLVDAEIVKCPRMNERLADIARDLEPRHIIVLVRDPRDVWASIMEKVATGRPTRMLNYNRLGVEERGVSGFSAAYQFYINTTLQVLRSPAIPLRIVWYDVFWKRKLATVGAIADLIGWPLDRQAVADIADLQLGPLKNKAPHDIGPKGPGRWRASLTDAERKSLEPAVSAYQELRLYAPSWIESS